VARQSTLA